jgi:hypothetical protein
MADSDLTDLRFVGPATAAVLAAADVSAADVREKRVDYETLLTAGVNPGVAARIRREHSLAWSHTAGGDLSGRAARVAGLGESERAWVAASAGDWEDREVARESGGEWRTDESAWLAGGGPRPVADLDCVSDDDAVRLAEAGVTSVGALARADAEAVASSLGLAPSAVAAWKTAAQRDQREE